MAAFIAWYIIMSLLGWLTFPLAYWLFPGLADRGYSLSRAAGLLLWGYLFWLLNSLGLIENNVGGVLLGLLLVAGLSLSSFFFHGTRWGERRSEIWAWIKSNLRLVISVEALFLVAFALEALLRAGNPQLDNAEKPMELMFINAILRSPTFPPHDAWLSGYAISYYYFGYVMAAMLAMLTGITGSVAHNLMTSLIFGLAAIGAFGILYNLLTAYGSRSDNRESIIENSESIIENRESTTNHDAPITVHDAPITNHDARLSNIEYRISNLAPAFLAPLFLLLVSNLEGFLEVLHRHAILWTSSSNFWTWLDIQELKDAPAVPLAWIPDRYWWWWRASRVISDYDLAGNFREIIDEFPFFSFLHADLHPHVLAIPFNLLAIAVALNLVLGGWRGETNLFGLRLEIRKAGFIAAALVLGGLAFLNTWDILVGAALIVGAYVLFRVHEHGWSWARLEDLFALGLPLGVLALLLYLPFYFGFSSQAGGILPNLTNPTRGAQLWVMFAPLWVPLFAYLLYVWFGKRLPARWSLSLILVVGLVILLWVFSWVLGIVASIKDPTFAQQYLNSQATPDIITFFQAAMARRFSYIGGLLTLLALLIPAVAFLIGTSVHRESRVLNGELEVVNSELQPADQGTLPDHESRITNHESPITIHDSPFTNQASPLFSFLFLLIVLGGLLVLAPDFVYLRDVFGYRINTVFKFYYQAWMLWGLAAAFATAVLLRELRGLWGNLFLGGLLVLLAMALTYPALAVPNKTNNFQPDLGWTLDDFVRIEKFNPDQAAATLWLKAAPYGTIAEAVPEAGGSYTNFARISEYTGLPAVLGWVGHEDQWRGSRAPQGTRQADLATLYNTPSWQTAQQIIHKYSIKYIYIGDLERSTYNVEEAKFQRNLVTAFKQGGVTIYEVP